MENIDNFTNDPKVWGPFYWYVLKSIAHNYPDNPNIETKNHVKGVFYGLQSLLPCSECRRHYREYLKKHPIEPSFENKKLLLIWINNLELSIRKRNYDSYKLEKQHEKLVTTNIKLITNNKVNKPKNNPKKGNQISKK